jgi:hypothetical protein
VIGSVQGFIGNLRHPLADSGRPRLEVDEHGDRRRCVEE